MYQSPHLFRKRHRQHHCDIRRLTWDHERRMGTDDLERWCDSNGSGEENVWLNHFGSNLGRHGPAAALLTGQSQCTADADENCSVWTVCLWWHRVPLQLGEAVQREMSVKASRTTNNTMEQCLPVQMLRVDPFTNCHTQISHFSITILWLTKSTHLVVSCPWIFTKGSFRPETASFSSAVVKATYPAQTPRPFRIITVMSLNSQFFKFPNYQRSCTCDSSLAN